MERRYKVRLQELLDDAVVRPEQLQGMLARLEQFVEPFAASLVRNKQRTLTQQYVAGLVSQVETKNVESIAYHHDPGSADVAEVYRPVHLGPSAADRRVGAAGRRGSWVDPTACW